MNQPEPMEWREQKLHRLKEVLQDSHSDLSQKVQELIKNIKDQHEQEQHRRKVIEETFSAFKIQLMTGAYDQQSLDTVDAQMSNILLIRHNSLIIGRSFASQSL